MKIHGLNITREARDKEWGFTQASLPRYHKGESDIGMLICHGFGGSPANMRCLYEKAVQMGYCVSMPLLTGHAKTFADMEKATWRDWRRDADNALQRLYDFGCSRIFLCGLSMGALLMADLAERQAGLESVDALMLICPPVKMKRYLNVSAFFAPLIPYVLTAEGFDGDPDKEMYYGMVSKKLNDIKRLSDAVRRHAGGISCPTLLVEAENDNRVDPDSYSILGARIPQAKLIIVREAPHGIPYSPKAGELQNIFEGFFRGAEGE